MSTNQEIIYGCDIGNAFAYAAVAREQHDDPLPRMPGECENNGIPTEACLIPPQGDEIVVYPPRRGRRLPMVGTVKRQLGCSVQPEGIAVPVPAERIYAAIVRDVIRAANQVAQQTGYPVSHRLVFTYPAAFLREPELLDRMEQSIRSVELDGQRLEVAGRLPEPAAAALDYLHYRQYKASRRITAEQYTVLVYDLGHGTFDLALVTARSKGEPYEVLKYDGDAQIGGKDFDDLLYNELCAQLKERYQFTPRTPHAMAELRRCAHEMKHELTQEEESVKEPALGEEELELRLRRSRFEELSASLLNPTMQMVMDMLDEAEREQIPVDAVILTGGASQMPMIENALRELLQGRDYTIEPFRPSTAVAFGAALYARYRQQVAQLHLQQSYGVRVPDDGPRHRLEGRVRLLARKDAVLPAESEVFECVSDSGTWEWEILHTDSSGDYAHMEECQGGVFRMRFDELPVGQPCAFRLGVDEDLHLRVTCQTPDGTIYERSTRRESDR